MSRMRLPDRPARVKPEIPPPQPPVVRMLKKL